MSESFVQISEKMQRLLTQKNLNALIKNNILTFDLNSICK